MTFSGYGLVALIKAELYVLVNSVMLSTFWIFLLARISHQDHGSRRRIRVRKRRSGAKSVAIATV